MGRKRERRWFTFHFTILAQAAPSPARPYLQTNQPHLVGKRLLIVDDNATNRSILTLQAQSWGLLPSAYASGQEALAQVQAGMPFDVAILDMQMPEMDGLMLAQQIQRHRDAQALPLVLFTSLGRQEVNSQGVEFATVLHKPIKPSHLYNALLALFAQQEEGQRPSSRTEGAATSFDVGLGQRLPLHILLAEDNTVNQKVAVRLLERMGYRADVVANGLEVLEALQRQRYDVILMDVQMPEMDGLEASRLIQENWPAEQCPYIVALTANAMQGDREECLAAGMHDYLPKPIQVTALQEALERAGRRAKKRTLPLENPVAVAHLPEDAEREVEDAPVLDSAVLSELRQLQGEGEPDIVQELAEAFQFETPALFTLLRQAVLEEQPEQLRRAAPNLKGSSSNLGACRMVALASELESFGKRGMVDGAAVLVADLEQEYQRVCQALAAQGGETGRSFILGGVQTMPTDDELFTPAEVLGGFAAKRARLLLFQIESRTAYLMTQARRTVNRYLTEEVAEQQDLAFFEALAAGREPPVPATIRDLERYAPQWQSLVPPNLSLQAVLAHLLGQKYRFTQRDIPHIRQALGLDSEGVQRAFERQYRQALDTIYSRQPGLLNWVRWRWNKLGGWTENLPPFWAVYSLILAEMVGASVLALPIALAGVGPLAGVVVLLVMGVFNVLTIVAMAEVVTRNGSMRYQGSYVGRLVQDYLGRPGSILLTTILFIDCCLLLLVYYLGISLTLAEATPVPAVVWAGIIFLLGIYFVRRKTLDATVTSALVVGAINLSLILILSILTLGHMRVEHLSYVHIPFLNGSPFEPVLLGLIFGIALSAYDGHLEVSSCARTMLQRDPGGRSLIWGAIAAEATAMVLYILWVVAINGAFAPQALAGLSGTVVTPLAQLLGPVATLCGTLLALLAMGMASITINRAIFFMVQERIPGQTRHTLAIGRRQGQVTFTPRGKAPVSLALTYLGLQGAYPQFRLDLQGEAETRRLEVEVHDTWEATTALAEFIPKFPPDTIQLTLQVLNANANIVRVQLVTTMRMRYEGNWDRLGVDLLNMADSVDTAFIGWLASREQTSVEEVAHFLEQTEQASQAVLNSLVEQGVLLETREQGRTLYRVHFAARRKRQATTAIWQALDTSGEVVSPERDTVRLTKKGILLRGMKELMQGNSGRFWLAVSPLILIFLVCEWLLLKRLESFAQMLGFLGIVALPVETGVFPALLLYASRRKGEYIPAFVLRFLAHPVIVVTIYLVSVGIIFLHGLFIWQDTLQRAIAILVGVVILVVTYLMVQQGAFTRRLVIEIRQDAAEEGAGTFSVTDSGRVPTQASVRLGYADGEQVYEGATGAIPEFPTLSSATFHLHDISAQELRVWLHRVTPEGYSQQLPALVKVSCGKASREFQVDGAGKAFVFPLREVVQQGQNDRPGMERRLAIEVQLAC